MIPANLRLAISEAHPLLRGWQGKDERPYRMAELVLKEKPKVVVEIGVFGGQSLIPQAMALKLLDNSGKIYGIDPYNMDVIEKELSSMDDRGLWLRQNMHTVLYDTLRSINAFGLHNHAILIIAESRDASTLFDSIDILHIDGAHTEEGALLDVNLYAKRVKSGGYIWLDDTHFPSLAPAMKELEYIADIVDDWGGYRLYRHK